ncbi:MAG: hypothetical protein U0414_26395 [Polyangiaceae bacterium]
MLTTPKAGGTSATAVMPPATPITAGTNPNRIVRARARHQATGSSVATSHVSSSPSLAATRAMWTSA